MHERVDPSQRPPVHVEVGDALTVFRGACFGDEEIHVVHLQAVHAISVRQPSGDALHPRRRLRQPLAVGHRDDGAEVAGERAAERRPVRRGARAEVILVDVVVYLDAVVRHVREVIGRDDGAQRVVDNPIAILPRKTGHRSQRPAL